MESFRTIAELNTCAIAFLQMGDDDRAKRTFTEALRQLQVLCHEAVVDPNGDDDDGYSNDHRSTVNHRADLSTYSDVWECESTAFSVEVSRSEHEPLDDLEATEIYSRAILLVNDIPASVTETTAVVFFNIGLVHHLEGLRTGRSANVQHALHFYERSLALLDDCNSSDDDGGVESCVVEVMVLTGALCHNMANCYNWFFQSKPLNDMLDKLSEVVIWMESVERMEYEDFEFFHGALVLAESNDFRHAAAA